MSLLNINPTKTDSWKELQGHYEEMKDVQMKKPNVIQFTAVSYLMNYEGDSPTLEAENNGKPSAYVAVFKEADVASSFKSQIIKVANEL